MNRLFSLFYFLFLCGSFTSCTKDNSTTLVQPTPQSQDTISSIAGWSLVWRDEFNGENVDLTKWNYQVGGSGWGNNELEYYTQGENSFTKDGNLVIEARQQSFGGRDYTSSRMNTSKKGDWTYGRFDIRAKLPYGQGIWPAIWMMPTNSEYGGWPQSGEIDIMELLGHDIWKMYGTIHFADGNGNHAQNGGSYSLPKTPGSSFAGSFHVFTVIWDSSEIKWYVDNTLYHSAPISKPFDKNFHIILNVAVGGNWPGNPNGTTTFPQQMTVDYVRVYKKGS